MFLATQLTDEARHIDVFLQRARAAAALGVSSVTTSRSLLSLLELEDFTEAAFLLSVLGEGTFLDLLRFVEEHAPDEVDRRPGAARARRRGAPRPLRPRARAPRARRSIPSLYGAPRGGGAAARRRAARHRRRARAAPGRADHPGRRRRRARAASRAATRPSASSSPTMHEGRMKRLAHAGFTPEQAQTLSDLHTPNFM